MFGCQQWGEVEGGEVGEVNNESVPNTISSRGGVWLWEASGASGASVCLLVSWCQECRVLKSKLRVPFSVPLAAATVSAIPYARSLFYPKSSQHWPYLTSGTVSLSLPPPVTEYISRFVQLSLLSPSFTTSQLPSPQAARPSFDFPINPGYGAWKWLDPIILAVSKRPEVILNEIVTVWGVLRDAKRVKLWLSSSF